ncbi:MAG: helix-turn-helix transcriptional regulator [Clostridia bacterium]|nr:helix-turn-helix transcriptional regulator [Clostridia bacterium]
MQESYKAMYLQIGLKIAYYRKLRGLTQEQLTEKVGKSVAFTGHIEAPNVNKGISLDTLFDIASILGVPVCNFLCLNKNTPKGNAFRGVGFSRTFRNDCRWFPQLPHSRTVHWLHSSEGRNFCR